jgi:hypothetical protein
VVLKLPPSARCRLMRLASRASGADHPGAVMEARATYHIYCQSWKRPGPAAKQPSPHWGQMTTNVVRRPQPLTPIVYSARWLPFTQGPWRAGWTTSHEIMTGVTWRRFISTCARDTAICVALS